MNSVKPHNHRRMPTRFSSIDLNEPEGNDGYEHNDQLAPLATISPLTPGIEDDPFQVDTSVPYFAGDMMVDPVSSTG